MSNHKTMDFMRGPQVPINKCPNPLGCCAYFDPMAGVTECKCGIVGWLDYNGDLFNSPQFAVGDDGKSLYLGGG